MKSKSVRWLVKRYFVDLQISRVLKYLQSRLHLDLDFKTVDIFIRFKCCYFIC